MGLIGAFASVGTIVGLFKQWVGHLTKIRDLKVQLGQGGLATQRSVMALGEQEQVSLIEATRRATEVAQAGSIPIEMGAKIRQAALSQIKGKDTGAKVEIAKLIAQTIGKTGGTEDEGVALTELLVNAGVKTPEQAKKALAQIQGALLGSPELSVGKFAAAVVGGGGALSALDVPLEDILALSAQGRQVAAGKSLAGAELVKQITANITNDKNLEIVRKESGAKTLDEARQLPLMDQIKAMTSAITRAKSEGGPAAVQMLLKEMEAAQRTQFIKFFSPAAVETGEAAREASRKFTVADLEGKYTEWAGTDPAIAARMKNRRELERTERAHSRFLKTQLREEAKARLEEARAAGNVGFLTDMFSTEEGQIENASAYVQMETLGLLHKYEKFRGKTGLTSAGNYKGRLDFAKRRLGIQSDTPILDLAQLGEGPLERLKAIQASRAAVGTTKDERERGREEIEDISGLLSPDRTDAELGGRNRIARPGEEGSPAAAAPELSGGAGGPGTTINHYTTINSHDENFFLGDKPDLTKPGKGGREQGTVD